MIGFTQVPPKDNGAVNPYAADPLGRDREQQQAHMSPEQFTSGEHDGELPGSPEMDADCSCKG